MLNHALIERALAWIEAEHRASDIAAARRRFETATGPIEEDARDYEQRITHFLEHFLCEEGSDALAAFARAAELTAPHRRELAGWLRSHRSVFAFIGSDASVGHLRDCVFGGHFRISPTESDLRLVPGDRFDGRLVPIGGLLYLAAGRVYHPREVHDALDALLPQLDLDSLPPTDLLDGLLLMRSRYLSFASVRAEHVYQARALAPVRLPLRRPTE